MRSSGAASRGGPRESSGSTCTRRRSRRFPYWKPLRPNAEEASSPGRSHAVADPSDGAHGRLDGLRAVQVSPCRRSAVPGWGGWGLVAVGLRLAEAALEPLVAPVHAHPAALPELP